MRAFSGAKTGPQKVKAHSAASNLVALFWSPKTDAKKETVSQKEVAPTFLEHLSQKSWAQKSGPQKSGPRHLGPRTLGPDIWAQNSGPRERVGGIWNFSNERVFMAGAGKGVVPTRSESPKFVMRRTTRPFVFRLPIRKHGPRPAHLMQAVCKRLEESCEKMATIGHQT